MKFVVAGIHIRVIGKAVHSLAKIGEELYIEPLDNGLAFRTLNTSRSAYSCFTFAPEIFEVFDCTGNNVGEEDGLKLKVSMKSCLAVFKSLSSIEKLTEKCKIGVNSSFTKLIFQLHQKSGIVKTFHLPFIECETMQAVFSKEDSSNSVVISSKLIIESLQNFQSTEEELTLKVTSERTVLRNNTEDEPDPNKVIHTELTLEQEEFETYNIGFDANVTFCLKELRAFLLFADVADFDIKINFENGGQPIVFSMDLPDVFAGDLVLATLAQNDVSEVARTSRAASINKKTAPKKKTNRSTTAAATSLKTVDSVNDKSESSRKIPDSLTEESGKRPRSESSTNGKPRSSNQAEVVLLDDDSAHGQDLPQRNTNGEADLMDDAVEFPELIPDSPPSKKFKSLFLNLSPTPPAEALVKEIIVYDTDEDD